LLGDLGALAGGDADAADLFGQTVLALLDGAVVEGDEGQVELVAVVVVVVEVLELAAGGQDVGGEVAIGGRRCGGGGSGRG
jgi:hypothetical protein